MALPEQIGWYMSSSFCFALAAGVGKTRLMGACMYYLWRSKGYRNFFILAPNSTNYDKLRAELLLSHAKYMFIGLSDFPTPEVYDGDNYLRFLPEQMVIGNPANVFIFNISKIFTRGDVEFKFHRFNEMLGDSFSAILQGVDDQVSVCATRRATSGISWHGSPASSPDRASSPPGDRRPCAEPLDPLKDRTEPCKLSYGA